MRAGRIVGLYLINFFSSAWIQCIALGTSNVAGYSKKGAYAAGVWVGYCVGNIMGPLMFDAYVPQTHKPKRHEHSKLTHPIGNSHLATTRASRVSLSASPPSSSSPWASASCSRGETTGATKSTGSRNTSTASRT